MTALFAVILVAVVACAAYLVLRRRGEPVSVAPGVDDFAELDEAERCDYVFALGALDGPANLSILRRALDDPSEIVATAAARSLVAAGHRDELEALLERRDDDRSQQIASTLDLLA